MNKRIREIGEMLIAFAKQAEEDGTLVFSDSSNIETNENQSDSPIKLETLRDLAKHQYQERSRRANLFNADLLGEPAWDILLDLFIAAVNGKSVSISSSCIASHVPPTTALRWLSVLEQTGLINKAGDQSDKRRTWVVLSEHGHRAMTLYLSEQYRNLKASSFFKDLKAY